MRVFETRLIFEPKTYDIDYAGIVSNQVYIRWLEDLRFEMIRRHFGWENFEPGVVPVLLRTEINYRRALRLFEKVFGLIWIKDLRGARWVLEAEFRLEDGTLVADARHEGIFFNVEKGIPIKIPVKLRKAVSSWKSKA